MYFPLLYYLSPVVKIEHYCFFSSSLLILFLLIFLYSHLAPNLSISNKSLSALLLYHSSLTSSTSLLLVPFPFFSFYILVLYQISCYGNILQSTNYKYGWSSIVRKFNNLGVPLSNHKFWNCVVNEQAMCTYFYLTCRANGLQLFGIMYLFFVQGFFMKVMLSSGAE